LALASRVDPGEVAGGAFCSPVVFRGIDGHFRYHRVNLI
jgi:hypothetical protein